MKKYTVVLGDGGQNGFQTTVHSEQVGGYWLNVAVEAVAKLSAENDDKPLDFIKYYVKGDVLIYDETGEKVGAVESVLVRDCFVGRLRGVSTADKIAAKCNAIRDMLLKKNSDYGNSALDPVRIFSKADAEEQIRVRIDDKLSRLVGAGEKNFSEDTVMDLVGYLILLMVKMEDGE